MTTIVDPSRVRTRTADIAGDGTGGASDDGGRSSIAVSDALTPRMSAGGRHNARARPVRSSTTATGPVTNRPAWALSSSGIPTTTIAPPTIRGHRHDVE